MSMRPRLFPLVLLPLLAALSTDATSGPPAPSGLMCELLAAPALTGITDPRPDFSWIVNSQRKNDVQTAYQVRVAPRADALSSPQELLWDSGKVSSDRSPAVEYAGKPLEPRRSYWWQVRTWDRRGRASGWSVPQEFRTGRFLRNGYPGADLESRFTVDRYPIQQTPVLPARVERTGPETLFIDFGRAAFGGLELTLDGGAAGRAVTVHLGEALESPRRVHRKPGGSIRYHRADLTLRGGRHTYRVPLGPKDAREMPHRIGAVMPYRYVEVEGYAEPLDRRDAVQLVAHYPFDDEAAKFTSSDPKLNAIWELCRYSMKATSFCGVYVDGDRERLPYEADAYINQLGHYAADREFTLARYSHEYLMLNSTWPTEWILHSVLMAWADYMFTGDRESLGAFLPHLEAKTLRALARPDGLISTVQPPVSQQVLSQVHSTRMRDIVDWPAGERDGYDMRPVNTVVNAFHYQALALMARIADVWEQREKAADYRAAAERVARALNEKLFDPKTGLYLDGEGSTHSSLHANMFPLAFGIVPAERVPKVAAFVRSKGMACSVYGAQYLLEALYLTGQADHALALMTAPGDRSWRHMVEDVGTTITLEAWDNRYKPNQDWNHAWGAAPANIIPRYLMGIEPLEPAFRAIRIRPQPGGLERASMDLPTIRGTIHAALEARPSRFVLDLRLPANSTAEIHLPRLGSDDPHVTVDGARRKGRIESGFVVVEGVGSGAHRLVRSAAAR